VASAAILSLCKSWLSDKGILLTAVPNKNSLHRQAALEMGLLSKLDDFSEKDKRHGHRRVFGKDEFESIFAEVNLAILKSGGYWLKPLSDDQIESQWTPEIIHAYFRIGEKYPEIAAELYVIAGKP
jgi:hypothetical protein